MADVEERLGARREGESVDDYVRRGFAEASGGRRYVADLESGDRRYAANTSYKGTKYASDSSLKGTKYSADRGLEGTKYRADVDERGNRMQAGNTFLKTYADLSSQPSNYFAAQNFLHNGVGAGYAAFVDDATRTVMPGRSFRPYVGAFPGNAAQALFQQGGDDRMVEVRLPDDRAAPPRYEDPVDPTPFVEPTTGTYWSEGVEPTTGRRFFVRVDADGHQLREDGSRFDQGGAEKARRRLDVDGLDHRFNEAYGRDGIARSALADWRRESGRKGPDLDDPVDRANFERYVEDWRGVRVASAPAPKPAPIFGPRPASFFGGPYEQGGESANWMTDDSWATPEDRQRLARMDEQFRPGVHKWKAGYWEGLDDTEKDLWRSYWGYRGLAPKSVEADIERAQPYNTAYFGQGRVV